MMMKARQKPTSPCSYCKAVEHVDYSSKVDNIGHHEALEEDADYGL